MTIQINTDKTLTVEERSSDFFSSQISKSLERFESHITRIEVHLKNENGNKEGFKDVSCLLEARMEGRQPIAITNHGDTMDLALSGAIDKIKAAIETIIGKNKQH
ncbi:MAG: ribosome-associated translation inhibitor RaiA [Sphingobacteriales bacterium]|jgi:ribosome-associated translation inhibitor RaiA